MNPNSCSLGSLFAGSFSKTTIDFLKDPPIRIVNIENVLEKYAIWARNIPWM
jgi:hypothetical protein